MSDDFWNLGEFHCLFRHPSLRYLHVSCLALPPDLSDLEPYAKSTPLTELVFDECELEPRSLGKILATPRNLKHLTLGENVYNINEGRGANPRLTRAPEAALAALSHVAHSLETLTHYDPAWRVNVNYHKTLAIPGAGMRDFHSLKTLRVDLCSFLHRGIALSHVQAPPNLDTLQIRNPRPRIARFGPLSASTNDDFFEDLPPYDPYTYLASLKTLEFVQGATSEMPMAKSAHITEDDALRERHKTGYKLFKHGINLKVTLEATWRGGLVPPFLHGEPLPELLCIYDAEEIGFRRAWAPAHEAEMRAYEAEYAQTSAWLRGDETTGSENNEGGSVVPEKVEEQETDRFTDSDIIWCRGKVGRSLNALWERMRRADPDESPHVFTVTIDSDEDDMWDDVLDEDDEDLAEWMDAEEGDVEYVLAEELLGPDGEADEMFWETQAQALLAAAEAVANEDEDEDELTEHDVDDDLD